MFLRVNKEKWIFVVVILAYNVGPYAILGTSNFI